MILSLTVIVQFLTQLLTGWPNEHVSAFGLNLASFVFQTIRFLTFASDDMPWPFSPWPDGASGDDEDTTTNIVADGQPPKPTASPSGILGGGAPGPFPPAQMLSMRIGPGLCMNMVGPCVFK